MYYYTACFEPYKGEFEGYYQVSFPDLEGCETFGEGINNSIENAMDVLKGYIDVELQEGNQLPKPTSYDDIKEKAKKSGIKINEDTLFITISASI